MPVMTVLFAIGVVVVLVIMAAVWIQQQAIKQDLSQHGVTAKATITNREKFESQSVNTNQQGFHQTSTTYYVTYRYEVNGTAYAGREAVSADTYYVLKDGSTTEVIYSPNNPRQVRLASDF